MIRGNRIALAPLRDADSESLFRWINDRELVLLSSRWEPVTLADHSAWFDAIRRREDVVILGIRELESDRLVGSCQLLAIDHAHGTAELQIRIGEESARGRGMGTEAVRLLLHHAFEDLGLRRIQLAVFATNAPAIRSYEKAGFTREGVLRGGACIDGEVVDVVVMGILRDELR